MDPVPLESGSYGGTYKLVGGEISLDLVNTVSWPGTDREHDWFDPPGNVTGWALAAGLIDLSTARDLDERVGGDAEVVASQVGRVVRIRQILQAVLAPLARGDSPSERAIQKLNRLLVAAVGRRHIDPRTLEWTWREPTSLDELMAPAVYNAAEVVTGVDRRRLRRCPSCDWLFHDSSRNASRRWCDMADCGSRDKALRYYHRHKPAS